MIGLLLINKPEGMTSYSAVSRVKRAAHEKRVGHTGTLDPMATGVLPVLLGRATALCGLLLDADKEYIAGVKLGIVTDTDDITGHILTEKKPDVSPEQLENALSAFCGKHMQRPPAYSALKKDGVRLYQLARQGKPVEAALRPVEIFSLTLLSPLNEEGVFTVKARVSKGTYIRSLARDIGEALGCGATLCSLQRTETAGISIDRCVPLEQLDETNINRYLFSEETAVEYLPALSVTPKQAIRFCNGGQLAFDRLDLEPTALSQGDLFRVKCADRFLGIGLADMQNQQIAVKAVIRYPEG